MKKFDKILSRRFFALSFDLKKREYMDLSSAIRVRPYLIIQETSGCWYNYTYSNSLIQINLFDGSGQEVFEMSEMEWKLDSFEICDNLNYAYQTTEFYAQIMDPLGGGLKRKRFGRGKDGLIQAIINMREMAVYECYEHFDLAIENEVLQTQIKDVSAEIMKLKELKNL